MQSRFKHDLSGFTYFDVETIPDQSPNAVQIAMHDVKPPANYKDPATIEKYKREKAEEAHGKTGLDGLKGHIACISAVVSGEPVSFSVRDLKDEANKLQNFFDILNGTTLVGHNIIGFDMVFLAKRALVLGVPLPLDHIWPRNIKPWGNEVFDTMTQFGRDMISMDNLCRALGIQGKTDTDGSMVAALWKQGEHDRIQTYCEDDVLRTIMMHHKFVDANW